MSAFDPVTLLATRVSLRWLTPEDAPAIFDLFSHPEVTRFLSRPAMVEREQATQLLKDILAGYDNGDCLQLGIERRDSRALIGTCTLMHFHRTSRRAELGYVLGRPHWGAGLMHEALQAFVGYAFDCLALNRLEADIDPRNHASARSLGRLGFVKEGHLRERWVVAGEVSDTGFYGLLRNDWMKAQAQSESKRLKDDRQHVSA
jgi:[ribosomal protein S5]-alanine N-acetyltransferase